MFEQFFALIGSKVKMEDGATVLASIKLFFNLNHNLQQFLHPVQLVNLVQIVDQVLEPLVLPAVWHNPFLLLHRHGLT